jgi:uncharacterized Zn finger protein
MKVMTPCLRWWPPHDTEESRHGRRRNSRSDDDRFVPEEDIEKWRYEWAEHLANDPFYTLEERQKNVEDFWKEMEKADKESEARRKREEEEESERRFREFREERERQKSADRIFAIVILAMSAILIASFSALVYFHDMK